MRLGFLLPLVSLAFLVGGGQGLYTVFTNREPLAVAIPDFIKQPPDAKWLKVNGGQLDLLNSVYESDKGDPKELYVPVVPPGVSSTTGTIRLLLLTKDPELVNFVNETRKLGESAMSNGEGAHLFAQHMAKMRQLRDVEGLVKFGINSEDEKKSKKIRELYPNLDADVIILEHGKKPDALVSIGLLAGGLALGGFLALRGLKKSTPPPLPPMPPPLPKGA